MKIVGHSYLEISRLREVSQTHTHTYTHTHLILILIGHVVVDEAPLTVVQNFIPFAHMGPFVGCESTRVAAGSIAVRTSEGVCIIWNVLNMLGMHPHVPMKTNW